MSFQPSMDIVHKRFPHLTKNILKHLDIQSLNRSKEANRDMAKCLNNEKFYWIRIIEIYKENFEGFEEAWREILYKIPLDMVKQLAIAVQQFFKHHTSKEFRVAPLHITADKGSLELCQYAFSKATDKNPEGKLIIDLSPTVGFARFKFGTNYSLDGMNKTTPLHIAAMNGNLELCSLIIDNGNPITAYEMAFATANDHFEVYRMLMERVQNKNPADFMTRTPLLLAAYNGNLDICKLIIENVHNKNPADVNGMTPLHYAVRGGHIDVCRLIIANVDDIHPRNTIGETPKHLADRINNPILSRLFQN